MFQTLELHFQQRPSSKHEASVLEAYSQDREQLTLIDNFSGTVKNLIGGGISYQEDTFKARLMIDLF
jgi:hypothetical protein